MNKTDVSTTPAAPKRNGWREYSKHGHYKRTRALKQRGYGAIDGRTYAGREAKAWLRFALERKGGASCPLHTRLEIDQATFDLWLLLALGETIARDANRRGTPLNRRRNVLPKIHEQYNAVAMRFARRCEALELEKGGLDLARRLQQERLQAQANGATR